MGQPGLRHNHGYAIRFKLLPVFPGPKIGFDQIHINNRRFQAGFLHIRRQIYRQFGFPAAEFPDQDLDAGLLFLFPPKRTQIKLHDCILYS